MTLGKDSLCRVPEEKHAAKHLTLGKDLFFSVVEDEQANKGASFGVGWGQHHAFGSLLASCLHANELG
jgi:hypothetical protein